MRKTILTIASLALMCSVVSFPASAQVRLGCATGKDSPTQGWGEQKYLTFTNHTRNLTHIYWVDESGASHYLGNVLENGGQRMIHAAPGTTIEIADAAGTCMEVFRVTEGQSFFDIN